MPLSLLILSTDSLVLFAGLVLVSHQLTYTLSSCATISAFCESASVELLRFILSSNVSPVSLEALNITSQFPDLLVHHTIYRWSRTSGQGVGNMKDREKEDGLNLTNPIL